MATSRSEAGPSLRKDGRRGAPFGRVLVANRGEIAVRIIRACHELGMEAVAVYSDVDAAAQHVRMADRAIRVGPAPAADSYLNIDAILDAASTSGAEAIHPGYGFLAERAAFARAVEAAGIVFVGPPSATIDALGDKLHARRTAHEVGVMAVPGTLEPAPVDRPDQVDAIVRQAEAIGFPLLVKAAAGGGGRGMRRVATAAELPAALASGSHEAASAFGDGSVYLEREIVPARHVEVQLLGDDTGRVIAIGERDCSLQRRHQKLVEEAPAPGLTRDDRRTLHDLAVRVATAAGLRNAATAEFLLAPDGSFYFLEVNTRLQVEHGVTELVSGLDIVREQLWLAAGGRCPTTPSPRPRRRPARPATPSRSGLRLRTRAATSRRRPDGSATGSCRRAPASGSTRVSRPAIASPPSTTTSWPRSWSTPPIAQRRSTGWRRALDETEIGGIQTTLPFHRYVARSEAFAAADLSTGWVGDHWDGAARLCRGRPAGDAGGRARRARRSRGERVRERPTIRAGRTRLGRRSVRGRSLAPGSPPRGHRPLAVVNDGPAEPLVDQRAVRVGLAPGSAHAGPDPDRGRTRRPGRRATRV